MGVLIRGAKDINGPGRVARKLGIGKDFNKEDLLISERIWLEETNLKPEYITTPRIGIDYARKEDRERLWRFVAYDSLKDIDI
jgi:DNA-3-methyladenine glycosylase